MVYCIYCDGMDCNLVEILRRFCIFIVLVNLKFIEVIEMEDLVDFMKFL